MIKTPLSQWLPVYILLALIWGSSYAFIELGLQSLTPFGVAACRIVFGTVTLLLLCAATKVPLPPRSLWPRLAVTALLATVIPWNLWAFAQSYIPSALAAILASSIPILTLAVMLAYFREEIPTPGRILGLVVGFVGILIVIGVWRSMGTATWTGIVAALIGNIAFATSLPYTRRHLTGGRTASTLPPLSLATGMFVFAALETVPFALVLDVIDGPVVTSAILGVIMLGCVCSGAAYQLNYTLIRQTDTTTASTVLYAMPIVGVALGVLFLGNHVSWNQPIGGVFILCGAAVAQGLLRLPRRRTVLDE